MASPAYRFAPLAFHSEVERPREREEHSSRGHCFSAAFTAGILIVLLLPGLLAVAALAAGGGSPGPRGDARTGRVARPRQAEGSRTEAAVAAASSAAAGNATAGSAQARPVRLPRRACVGECLQPARDSLMQKTMALKVRERAKCEAEERCPLYKEASSQEPCVDGLAGEYPCNDVDMLAFLPLSAMGGSVGASDIWGWTDSTTGREYALVGISEGAAFIDVTDPLHPQVLGAMSSKHDPTIWHDLKVYKDHVFIVSEAAEHGMQVFDLARLRGLSSDHDGLLAAGAIQPKGKHMQLRGHEDTKLCLDIAAVENAQPSHRFLANSGTSLDLRRCESGRRSQQWRHDSTTGLLRNGKGLCLDAVAVPGQLRAARLRSCSASSASQRWQHSEDAGTLRGLDSTCLALEPGAADGKVRLVPCHGEDGAPQLRIGWHPPVRVFEPDVLYEEVGSAHNLVINEQTGMAYVVGSRTCNGGLHMVNITAPKEPRFIGCFAEDGYVHDSQCVIYEGPDSRYQGREICFNYNEDTLTITDVTDKDAVKILSRVGYDNSFYTHQGWLDEKQEYLFLNDELDERNHNTSADAPPGPTNRTRTLIWDARDLQAPKLVNNFYSKETAIDHNLYVDGDVIFETNYCAGLRILEIMNNSSSKAPSLREIGHFDVDPDCSSPVFSGTWSSYPYFKSGTVVATSMERGVFVLRPKLSDREDLVASRLRAHKTRVSKGMSS
uniref:Ricin B lectin domain-containing protein n=1 Tax=Zooxanthella nutricula TaxID=1333877 RepID=A0A7S2NQC9_9DINO